MVSLELSRHVMYSRGSHARYLGTGLVAARAPKKLLEFAGIEDVFSSSSGSTKTLGNFVKV